MMFGTKVRYGITYKTNQPGFQVYTRKFYHNFKVAVTQENFEGARGSNLGSMDAYVMCERTRIGIYDQVTFKPKQQWNVPTKSQKDDIQILFLAVSDDQTKIGVALGKVLIKDQQVITEIAIYKKSNSGKFQLEKLRDFESQDACIQFFFSQKRTTDLLFFTKSECFLFDYLVESKERETLYAFENELNDQPKFGQFNRNQTKFIITSASDILYVDIKEKLEIDIDDREGIAQIQNIIADEENFYVLANKKDNKLGYFLLTVNIDQPHKESSYLIKWSNKLDIGNCDLHMMKENGKNMIVISYKCIGINTFNVFVIDIDTNLIVYWHESYQLWESPVKGFLLNTNDFLILSKDGINLLALGEKPARVVQDNEGFDRMIHSVGSCNYLKIESTNHLLFACQFYENRQICIQEQYNDLDGNTHFDDIFRVKVNEITLRELMLI